MGAELRFEAGVRQATFHPASQLGSPGESDLGFVGRIGCLAQPVQFEAFVGAASTALGDPSLRASAGDRVTVQRVAVVPGSGAGFIETAVASGADVLVTGDVSHHKVVEARDRGMAVIDAGRAPIERPRMRALVDLVASHSETIDLTSLDPTPWR